MSQTPVLTVRNLSSYYEEGTGILSGKSTRHQVLKNVSFDLYDGEILGLVGESGSGKTTLSRVITGLVKDYE